MQLEKKKEVFVIRVPSASLRAFAVNASAEPAAGIFIDGRLKVWNVNSGKLLRAFKVNQANRVLSHRSSGDCLAISPDNRFIAYAVDSNTVTVIDAVTGKAVASLGHHVAPVESVVFAPDGKRIVTGCWDEWPKIWDVETGRELLTLDPLKLSAGAPFSRSHQEMLLSKGIFNQFRALEGIIVRNSGESSSFRNWLNLSVSPDGNKIAMSANCPFVIVWRFPKTNRNK